MSFPEVLSSKLCTTGFAFAAGIIGNIIVFCPVLVIRPIVSLQVLLRTLIVSMCTPFAFVFPIMFFPMPAGCCYYNK